MEQSFISTGLLQQQLLFNMRQTASIMAVTIGRNNLFKFLRNSDVLLSNNTPENKYIEEGYFTSKMKFNLPNDPVHVGYKTTLVTKKGLLFIHQLLINNEINKYAKHERILQH